MTMTKKQLFRSVLFSGVLIAILWLLSSLFNFQDLQITNRYKTFRKLEKNTVDAVLVGTSGMDRYWIGPKAYEEYGLTVYPLSCDQQAGWLMKNVLEEAKRKQDISLAIIDMRPFLVSYKNGTQKQENSSRRVLDELPFFSLNRLDAVRTTLEVMELADPEGEHSALSYYLPFVKYHSQWENKSYRLNEDDEKFQPYFGYFVRNTVSTRCMTSFPVTEKTDEKAALDPIAEKALYELLEYLDKQEYEVLFLNTPHYHKESESMKLNTVKAILDERGYAYKSYDVEDGTFNLQAEFYNDGHVNYYGSERFTELFAQYLKENYDLPDRRGDSRCAKDWEGPYDAIKELMNSWSKYRKMKRPELSIEKTEMGVQLQWETQKVIEGYEIYRNTTEGGRYEVLAVVNKEAIGSYLDETVEAGQEYFYMIRAFRTVNEKTVYSTYSPVVSFAN